jgi:hypothetical protein
MWRTAKWLAIGSCLGVFGCQSPRPREEARVPEKTPVPEEARVVKGLPLVDGLELLATPAPAAPSGPALRPFTLVDADYGIAAAERSRLAGVHKGAIVRELFEAAGVSLPPAQFLLRAFKEERELEVWASSAPDEPLVHVTTYSVCAASGHLGPKRREGDRQVPEGYYKIAYLWPDSDFYLALNVGYPNVSDKILGDQKAPGSDIMIHGGCASIGCLAMSDERIQEIWVMASEAQKRGRIHVHIYPTRDQTRLRKTSEGAIADGHRAFWDNLYEGHALFEADHRLPAVSVDHRGRYRFIAAR